MPSPFPGMDPYLEHPAGWQGFHTEFAAALQRYLAPRLRPRYYVALEERVYLAEAQDPVGAPDATIHPERECPRLPQGNGHAPRVQGGHVQDHGSGRVLLATLPVPEEVSERYLEVRQAETDAVVTVVEFLSPSNKSAGPGRAKYLEKRMAVLGTRTNLVEIDLLRAGEPMPATLVDVDGLGDFRSREAARDYRILVARGRSRPYADVYTFTVRQPLPEIAVPLGADDGDVLVDLQDVFTGLYDTLAYDVRLRPRYRSEPVPPLKPADAAWADRLLREAGLR
jgi:hypothetical protein